MIVYFRADPGAGPRARHKTAGVFSRAGITRLPPQFPSRVLSTWPFGDPFHFPIVHPRPPATPALCRGTGAPDTILIHAPP